MFAAAGVMIKATGQDTVAEAGRNGRAPAGDFLRLRPGGHDLMGLPPSSGFLAKWQIIDAALAQGHWVIAVVALAGGLLAAVYVFACCARLSCRPRCRIRPRRYRVRWNGRHSPWRQPACCSACVGWS